MLVFWSRHLLRAKLRRADIDASAARTLRRLCGRSTHLATIFGVVLNWRGGVHCSVPFPHTAPWPLDLSALLESFWQARHPPDTPPISVRHHPGYSEIEVIDDDLGRSAAGGLHTPASSEW
ncbi:MULTISPECIES: hypothetical protein [unclassified Bradyrhizobium]|uniref:hypothetical protein n=1 Tax=unclassified Bradyrhizobium TaxID=2631580 RepID=UPI001FF8265F|nr:MULTISPECIES: hypothetical protein [unclassified Bradyrhizobium]